VSIAQSNLRVFQTNGFPVGGEPAVALDLVDTVMADEFAGHLPADRFDDAGLFDTWWHLESHRLPAGPVPDAAAARRVRSALRELFEAAIEHRAPSMTAVDDVNACTAAAPVSRRLSTAGDEELRWHTEHGGSAKLAAIASDAIELLSDTDRRALLRRCANAECGMLFLAENPRRQWCASNVCGNRARVARHYNRKKLNSAD